MKNKYLFLDFDGVLNSNKNYRTLQMLGVPARDEYGTIFDPLNILLLIQDIRKYLRMLYLSK